MGHRNRQMNQPVRPQPPQNNNPVNSLSPEIIQGFLQNQQAEAQNEANRIRLREKEIQLSAEFSSESLKLNAQLLNKQPSEDRKMITLVSGIGIVVLLIVIGFIVYLIESGQKEFVLTVLKGIGVLLLNALSYYFGKSQNSKSKTPNTEIPTAETVD